MMSLARNFESSPELAPPTPARYEPSAAELVKRRSPFVEGITPSEQAMGVTADSKMFIRSKIRPGVDTKIFVNGLNVVVTYTLPGTPVEHVDLTASLVARGMKPSDAVRCSQAEITAAKDRDLRHKADPSVVRYVLYGHFLSNASRYAQAMREFRNPDVDFS